MPRQQFNVNLEPELVRRVKHHAIDAQLSLSDLVGQVLEAHLEDRSPEGAPVQSSESDQQDAQGHRLRLQPMVHVDDMAAAVDFYTALGASVLHGSRDGDFTMLSVGGSSLSLLAHPPNPEQNEGTVELNFESAEDLERVQQRLSDAGVEIVQPVSDEGFGRQLQVSSPDGLLIKINQLEPELYS